MDQKKYWQSFGEKSQSEAFQQSGENEFREDLPMEGFDSKGLLDAKSPRRDFLKYLGFSTAAATLAASCEIPVRKVIPYVNKPENIIPGVANYYATTYVSGGDIIPVVAKVRDGRPIKIEGNELCSITKGGTSARVQASVLDLYDTARLPYPVQMQDGQFKEVSSFEAFDKLAADALASLAGAPLVILSSTITSPTSKQIITDFLAKYPGSRHIQYDADSYSALQLANEACYGKRSIPTYRFDNANVIVSLGADFLGTWLSPVEFARQYVKGRKIDEKNPSMSRHYQFESHLSVTGGNADFRYTHRPSESGAVALALLAELGGTVTAPALDEKLKSAIRKAAKDLQANKGKALVVSGSQDMHVQVIVHAINEAVGASNTTIDWANTHLGYQALDSEFTGFVNDLESGKVGGVIVYGANPVYDYFDGAKFKAALKKAKVSISFNDRLDETTEHCKLVIPAPHFLESWGDAEIKPGHFTFMQPTIAPLFKTRQFQDSLLKWSGSTNSYEEFFKQYWSNKLGGIDGYMKALQDGISEPSAAPAPATASFNAAKVSEAASAISSSKKGGKLELVLYQKIGTGTGRQANNPWLQELADPISRATWDNYAIVSPKFAKENWNIDVSDRSQADKYEVHPEKPVVRISANGKKIEVPAVIIPGIHSDVIALAVGYGRESEKAENTPKYIGRAVAGAGRNAFPLAMYNGSTIEWYASDATIEKTGEIYQVAVSQTHSNYEGRTEVVKEMTLEDFHKDPGQVEKERDEELKNYGGLAKYREEGTLYGSYDTPGGIHWGMSVDMNSCIGCGACVVACYAENNIPVVGKREVMFYHDMQWIRIDRYFSGNLHDADSIQTVFQPMLCQHCDNAPCENVCPVAATNHSTEGLNQMAYNRCIGTRYCANNCPFKVRRFNWADYTGADSFPNNQQEDEHLADVVHLMNEELPRMVLNPDVTVRSRGVMEKCTFCVQRLQDGKLKAKKEDRPLKDMVDIQTACQQACPTEAIVFGNVKDKEARITKTREESSGRLFFALEELHVLPNVNYLAKVRNTDHIAAKAMEMAEEKETKKAEPEAPAK